MKRKKQKIDCGNKVSVIYNHNYTEFDVHLRLFFRLSMLENCGFIVRPETLIKCDKMSVIADIMIFKDLTPICAVEVKKDKIDKTVQNNKQLKIYQLMTELSGIPIFYCQGFNDIKPTYHRIMNYLNKRYSPKKVN
jgi:hypothetical protein